MSKNKLESKVGWFVFIGLVLLGALLVQFSKGTSILRRKYQLHLVAANVGGIKPQSGVLMSGVPVGRVSKITLAPDGRSVTIAMTIYRDYSIHGDARFVIEQSGFLGDQFVSIYPTENRSPVLTNNATVKCEEPFNLQEVARSAMGFIKRMDATAQDLQGVMGRVNQSLLSAGTLSNLTLAIDNVRRFSSGAVDAVSNFQAVVQSSVTPMSTTWSNVNEFTIHLNEIADGVQEVIVTNSAQLASALSNVEAASVSLRSLMAEVESGRGLAGTVIKDQELSGNISQLAANLAITSSNLNRLGVWGILWARRPPPTNTAPPKTVSSGKYPAR